MKPNIFKYSLVTASVIVAMGITTSAIATGTATQTASNDKNIDIVNVATANYSVANVQQPAISSNTVTIRVSEKLSFSLVSNNSDGSPGNESNVNEVVAPNGFAVFEHTLTNTGNRSDSYKVLLENVGGDDTDYDLTNSKVKYSIYNSGQVPGPGVTPVSTQTDISVDTANGQTLTLEKGQFIKFTISAKTTGNKGGNQQNLKLSATSTLMPAEIRTLSNTDNSVTKLPTFSIVKTFTNGLDLNDANDTAAYRIIIKNPTTSYSATATDITITDNLPAGLIVASAVSSSNVTVAGNATSGTVASNSNGFTITGAGIPVGGSITINFTVKKDPNTALATGALNHVKVTDDLDNNPNTDNTLIDSTDSTAENVSNFYPVNDEDFVNGNVADGTNGNDSTQPLLTINRKLELSNPTIREIAPTGQVTHQTIITNKGQNAEGTANNGLTFTIVDGDNEKVNPSSPVTIIYDADGLGTASQPGQPITITPVDGVYTINPSILPNGIAPTGTVTINYNVASDKAVIGSKESTVVTLLPKNEGAPVVPSITDTTNVKGLTLVKSQALDSDCDGTIDADTTFSSSSTTPLGALPGQCAIYRVAAFNTSSTALGFDIKSLTISDLLSNFSASAEYKTGTTTNTTVTSGSTIGNQAALNTSGDAVSTTITTLAPQGTATMQFAVKIKTNR